MRYYPLHLSHQVYALLNLVYGEYFHNPGGHFMGILPEICHREMQIMES